jgi:hypothetical protein
VVHEDNTGGRATLLTVALLLQNALSVARHEGAMQSGLLGSGARRRAEACTHTHRATNMENNRRMEKNERKEN